MTIERAAPPRVVIIGAGFGGLAAAKRLEKHDLDITVVDRNNYHTFLPLLYQVATAGLNAADVGYPVRGLFRRRKQVLFRQGVVEGIDWSTKTVLLADDEDDLEFDYVIISAGAAANFFAIPGAERYAFPLYTMSDALGVRNHLLSLFEAADARRELMDQGILNFVVVGGGPTGVEVAGAIAELVQKVLVDDFHDLDVTKARVMLVERADTVLTPFAPPLRDYTVRTLERMGVDVRLDAAVARIAPDHVVFTDGSTLATHMVVWGAGIRAQDLAEDLDVATGPGGRITVGSDLGIPGHPGAFAIGDIADIDDGAGGRLPQLAQVAIQGGKFAADQVLRSIAGAPHEDFHYRDKGIMATIGRRAAVAQLPNGTKLKGFIAWLSWLFLHLVYLLGFRNRVSVLLNWSWNYLTWDRGPRLILAPEALPRRHLPGPAPGASGAAEPAQRHPSADPQTESPTT